MAQISPLHSLTLDLPPSCVVFSPSHPDFCVIGTYFLHLATNTEESGDSNEVEGDGGDGSGTGADQAQLDDDEDEPQAQRQKAPQKRSGSLMVFRVDRNNSKTTEISTLPTPYAVLDAQWSPHHQHSNILAVAASTGRIFIYSLHVISPEEATLIPLRQLFVADSSILVLSLAWHPQSPNTIGYTLSNGEVNICNLTLATTPTARTTTEYSSATASQETDLSHTETPTLNIHTHTLEAWTLSWTSLSPNSTTGILSGGDDQYLRFSPFPTQNRSSPSSTTTISTHPPWKDHRIHSAGVTAILPLPSLQVGTPDLLVTGSYDDRIRLLRVPGTDMKTGEQMVRRRCDVVAELDLGGGVWRLKLLPSLPDSSRGARGDEINKAGNRRDKALILASCMHAGTRIVALRGVDNNADLEGGIGDTECQSNTGGEDGNDDGQWEFEVLARFEEHESMNYGSDVQPPQAGQASKHMIVSTSFYDRRVCLWNF